VTYLSSFGPEAKLDPPPPKVLEETANASRFPGGAALDALFVVCALEAFIRHRSAPFTIQNNQSRNTKKISCAQIASQYRRG
jgi:hypothetical protein